MLSWTGWDAHAFAAAARLDRPILLHLSSRWRTAGVDPVTAALTDARVQELIEQHYVAMRVDADYRPDIAARYALGAGSSLLVLTPEGDILTGGTRIEPRHLATTLASVIAAFRSRRAELIGAAEAQRRAFEASATHPAGPDRPPDRHAPQALLEQMAGRGEDALVAELVETGMPQAASLLSILRAASALGDVRANAAVVTALEYGLAPRRWPRGLVALAAVLELLLAAAASGDRPLFLLQAREVADALGRLQSRLGGGNSRASDGTDADDRAFTDANAMAVRALLHASQALREPTYAEGAIAALENVVLTTYEKGGGVAHVCEPEGDVRGLLADQVEVSAALIDAHDATGMPVYRDLAEELMRALLRTHWDANAGAFRDRLHAATDGGSIGLLALPRFPIGPNTRAARVLARLDPHLSDGALRARALDILGAFAGAWPALGSEGHAYVDAVLDICPAGQ